MNFKTEIERCTTRTQVEKVLKKHGVKIIRDEQKNGDTNYYSVWVDDKTRIYQRRKGESMILQGWKWVDMSYSGLPVFFGSLKGDME